MSNYEKGKNIPDPKMETGFTVKICIKKSGGSYEIFDEGLLDSAIQSPFQTFGGIDLYPDIIDKAAQLCYSLINNHTFRDTV